MARRKQRLPTYGLHKATGQARVYLNGRDHYLGEYDSEESRRKYGELIARFLSGQSVDPLAMPRTAANQATEDSGPSVAELLLAFRQHAIAYYTKDGKPTAEVDCFSSAMRPVSELYDLFPAKDFSPLHLKAVREQYVANGWTRGFCNKSTCRIRQIWKWGVENGMIPVATWQALQAVSGLKAGRTAAPDRKRREAVSDERIEAVRPYLSQHHRDLFDLLRATGSRPSELLCLTMADIDTTADVWVTNLKDHKTAHRGLSRKLFFGPKSQLILRRCPATGSLFTFCRKTFSAAVRRACIAAQIPPFVPYQLRHTKATQLRDTMSIEAAQATLGHAQPSMTARYSKNMDKLGIQAARDCG